MVFLALYNSFVSMNMTVRSASMINFATFRNNAVTRSLLMAGATRKTSPAARMEIQTAEKALALTKDPVLIK